jgi:hypothetical protein
MNLLILWLMKLSSEFPPIRSINHHIDLILGTNLPNKVAYRMNPKENKEIKSKVHELLDTHIINFFLILWALPTMLCPNKDGGWRMCIDFRAINKITIMYIFPLPRIDDLMDCLSGAKYFSKLDLKSGYHQIRIREVYACKTTFKTNDGLYK